VESLRRLGRAADAVRGDEQHDARVRLEHRRLEHREVDRHA
jgi:hypothetical protein